MNARLFFYSVCAASFLLTSCEKNGGDGMTGQTVAFNVQPGVVTDFTAGVSVSAVPEEAEGFVYAFKASEYEADSAGIADRMRQMSQSSEYAEYRFAGSADMILSGLDAGEDYMICVIACGDAYAGDVTAHGITTADAMQRLEVSSSADILDWGQEYEMTNASFNLRIGNAELRSGEYFDYFAGGSLATIYGVRKLDSLNQVPSDASVFSGIYRSGAGEDVPGNIAVTESRSRFEIYEEDGTHENDQNIEAAAVQIVHVSDEVMALTATFTLTDGSSWSCYYKGNITLADNGYYGVYNYKPSLDRDITGLDYPFVKYAYYCGDTDGLSRYSIAVVNDPDPGSSYGGDDKHTIKMEFYVPAQADPYNDGIPAGEYPVSTSLTPVENTTIAGDYRWYNAMSIDLLGSFYYLLHSDTYEQTTGYMRSGKITVERDGDKHVFTVDAMTWDGYRIQGTSTQESMTFVDEPAW